MLAPPALKSARSFEEIDASAPDLAALRADYEAIETVFDSAGSTVAETLAAFARWDIHRRAFRTWAHLTESRFRADTVNPERKRAADLLSELQPAVESLDAAIKRKLLASPLRAQLERELGSQPFALWEADIAAHDPVIEPLAVQESGFQDQYTALLASARFEFRGERLNLPRLAKYGEHPEREVRREAASLKWDFFSRHRERLDRLYDELVHLRHRMARELGFSNFIDLAYRRLRRTDYGPDDVARYRQAIARDVVPLAQRIVDAQARAIGVDRLMLWDEAIFDTAPAPKPPQSAGGVLDAAEPVFDALGSEIGGFARLMRERGMLDLESREGKGNGGFCSPLPDYGVPFVFANFNGTTHDAKVLVHEMGHAFQSYASREKPVSDSLWPTLEACEIHSMSMEFLTWPHAEAFFGADAGRYRVQHLESSILSLPYIAAVDHFQHEVYARPGASPEQRRALWKEMEARYLPWRRYEGIEHLEHGGFWQAQLHIYGFPFYYIDYGLAMCCALQFWARSLDDHAGAVDEYRALCARGGELPFGALVRSAGLRSPFEDGVLHEVTQRAETFLTALRQAQPFDRLSPSASSG